jgi:chromate transporter
MPRAGGRGARRVRRPLGLSHLGSRHLAEVARVFTKLGVIGFGGPAAHIALMRDELVRRRKWLDDQDFLDVVGATNLIPGPNSTEVAIYLGHRRAGWRGLIVAGLGFILPAVAIVLTIAWLYARYGTEPAVIDLRYGILPVIIAIVVHALLGLARTACKDLALTGLAIAAAAAWLAGVNELLILAASALLGTAWMNRRRLVGRPPALQLIAALWLAAIVRVAAPDVEPSLWRLFLVFAKVGAVLYGSGYVLLAFLEQDLVEDLGWLTSTQLLDAVAVGQVTPGPVFTTATFVGYQIEGFAGAAVATIGIFLPAFVFVGLLAQIVPAIRRSPWAGGALDGVNAASLGLMAGVTIRLSETAFPDALSVAVGAVALVWILWRHPNSAWVVAAGAGIGLLHGWAT